MKSRRWSRLPTTARWAFQSVGTALTAQGVLLVSGVLAARMLGPENRGHLALLALVPSVVCQLGLLGTDNAVTYYIARDRRATGQIVRTTIVLALVQLVLCSALNAFVIWFLVRDESHMVQAAAWLTLVVPPTILVRSYGLAILQGMRDFRPFNILRLVQPLLYAGGLVAMFVIDVTSLDVVAAVWSAASIATAAITAVAVARAVPPAAPEASVPTQGDLVRFGAKGFLGAVSPLETFRLDQAVVGLFLSPTALGIYVASLAFTNLPRFIAQSVGMVAFPHIAGQPNDRLARRSMWRFFWPALGGSVAVVLALVATAPRLIPLAFGEDFRDAVVPMQILLVGSVVFGARRVLGEGLRGRGYPAANTVAEIASWIWLLPAFALLVPWLEVEGVAIALVSASFVSLGVLATFMVVAGRSTETGNQRLGGNRTGLGSRLAGPDVARRSRRALLFGAFFAGAAATGWAMAIVAEAALVVVAGLVGLALILLARRPVIGWLRKLDATVPKESSSVNGNDRWSALVLPRFLYYVGAALIAVLSIRPTPALTISDWFFLASLLSAIAVLLLSGQLSASGLPQGVVIGLAIFAGGAIISSMQSASVLASISMFFRFAYLIVAWFWLGTVVLETPRHVRTAVACWTASVALSGAASVAQLRLGDVIPGTSPVWGRMTGLAQHVNDLGASSAVALVPAIMISSVLASLLGKLTGVLVILPLVAAGLLLSGSVGGLAAASVGVLFWLGMGRLSAKVMLAGVVVGLGILLVLSVQQNVGAPTSLERLQSSTDASGQYCTLCTRLDADRAAWDEIGRSPLIGAGMTTVTTTGIEVHNMILGAWFEAGLLGAIGMIVILVSVGFTGVRAIRGARSREEWTIGLALFTSFISFVVIGMSAPILFQRYGWIGAGLLLVLRRQQEVQRAGARVRALPRGSLRLVQQPARQGALPQ